MGNRSAIDRDEIMLLPERLDDYVRADNPVRALDAWVDKLDLAALGFSVKAKWSVGRPGFPEAALLKLLIYGYLNRIRSSRLLESETHRNLEVIWLTCKLQPDHWTINDFRRTNLKAFKATLKEFHVVCRQLELFGRELMAIDGSFFKASNSKANNFTQAKIERMEAKVDKAIEEYNQALEDSAKDQPQNAEPKSDDSDSTDDSDSGGEGDQGEDELQKLKERKHELEQLKEQAQESESGQVSLVDTDSRLLKKGNQNVVGHNVQISVDSKAHLIVWLMIAQAGNDMHQLEPMAQASCGALEIDPAEDEVEVLADGGYANSSEIAACEKAGIKVHVPEAKKRQAGNGEYPLEKFDYDARQDQWKCPQGERLVRHKDTKLRDRSYRVYYNTEACRDCPVREQCTTGKYRKLKINEHHEELARVAQRMAEQPEKYAKRKALAEHPFGTFKAVWGYGAFLLRGREGCEAELSLMALSYNWKRVLAEVGVERMLEAIELLPENAAASGDTGNRGVDRATDAKIKPKTRELAPK